MGQPDARPFLVASRKAAAGGVQRYGGMRRRTANQKVGGHVQFSEVRAYRRIAESFAQTKR